MDDETAKLDGLENMEVDFDIKIQLPGTAFLATWMREMRIREQYNTSPYFSALCWEGGTSWKSSRELTDDPGSDINLNFSLKKANRDPQIPETTIEIKETDSLNSEPEDSEAGDRERDSDENDCLDNSVPIRHHPPPEMDEEIFVMYRDCVREFIDNGRIQHPIDPALATIKEEDASCNDATQSSQDDAFYATAEEQSSADEEFFVNSDLDYEKTEGTQVAVCNSEKENGNGENVHKDETSEVPLPSFNVASFTSLNPQEKTHPSDEEKNKNKSDLLDSVKNDCVESKRLDQIVAAS